MNQRQLKRLITQMLQQQGFAVQGREIIPPSGADKEQLRALHSHAVSHRRDLARKSLARHEDRLLSRLASGDELCVQRMSPRLKLVESRSQDELLFRYATLHWSIPVSSGYGRRLRFLVIDESNGKLMGVIGLGDPVYALGDRDRWIGWGADVKRERLHHVMDAFALGAVPPYSQVLGGKLVAALCASSEVRQAFSQKYGGHISRIKQKSSDGQLALITTTSALGRSSIYNRLNYGERAVFERVGFTRGSGEFQFCNGVYAEISAYAAKHCQATAKQERWGSGFRNKREVLKKCLPLVGLSSEMLFHGVQREIFVVPLASNTRPFLQGEDSALAAYPETVEDYSAQWRDRWMLPRSRRDPSFRSFLPEQWRLWPTCKGA